MARFSLKTIFVGAAGMRTGWRVLLFVALLVSVIALLITAIRTGRAMLGMPGPAANILTPGRALLTEACVLVGVLFTTRIFARFERRGFADYGLPIERTAVVLVLEGLVWGVALMSGVLLVLKATGNFSFGPISLQPGQMAAYSVVWAIVFGMVGVAETFAVDGYVLFTLARALGFWPAATLLAALFGTIHFVVNAGETWLGSVSLAIVGLAVGLTIRRTGTLWFAIGIHAAWDWAQSFLYGVPDSGIVLTGHLLTPTWRGSPWMTGGTAGPEASVVTVLGYVAFFAMINVRFPRRVVPRPLRSQSDPTRPR